MTEPTAPELRGGRLLAAAMKQAVQPPALLGDITIGTILSVNTDDLGGASATVQLKRLPDPLTVDSTDWFTWFMSEVEALGSGTDGIVGRRVVVLFADGQPLVLGSLGG